VVQVGGLAAGSGVATVREDVATVVRDGRTAGESRETGETGGAEEGASSGHTIRLTAVEISRS
jgi:hypothetical protein